HQFEKAILNAVEEVEKALLGHSQELRRLEHLRAAVAANRRALDLATDRYTSGLENFLSVLDAQRALYAAEDEQARRETSLMGGLSGGDKEARGGAAGGGRLGGPEPGQFTMR